MNYSMDLRNFKKKEYYPLGEHFEGTAPDGTRLSFNNYYMEINGKPFPAISGEFHFSRMEADLWEDELIKMKMGGINVIATYVFWIHHEEEEGIFTFEGRKDLRRFVELCQKHGLYVILRVGPFAHGEVRNGGLPDWLYGKPFESRKLNEGFMRCTGRWYEKIGEQTKGLYFKDGGPIIAAQIDNEYMHSSAPWEITTGVSNEWVFGGDDGEAYMLKLQELAREAGIDTPFYTCTGWGGAVTPSVMLPLWGGYAYRPWIFLNYKGEHPSTEEYVYQDFHNNEAEVTSDFHPAYEPESRPYACCEMGGGMMCTYYYRFQLPYKSVDAMCNIKLASGCNYLGYYVFQGGTNPKGKHGTFMNESQVAKLSYDYQAPLGEFGQIRPSYQRLKTMHQFCTSFADRICDLQTMLPEGASRIAAGDLETLRYAVRTDGKRGFVFLNNFQDHEVDRDKVEETIALQLRDETLVFEHLGLRAEENAILPFHFDLDGMDLVKASAQPVTRVEKNGEVTYVFLKPEGMKAVFTFAPEVQTSQGTCEFVCDPQTAAEVFTVSRGEQQIKVLCLSRSMTDWMYLLSDQTLLFAEGAVLEDAEGLRLESTRTAYEILTYPRGARRFRTWKKVEKEAAVFDCWKLEREEKKVDIQVRQTAATRYTIAVGEDALEGVKDARLQIRYQGDLAGAFIDGDLVHDNFCNGAVWEIGLRHLMERLKKDPLTIVITPLKEGANVHAESAMAGRMEHAADWKANLESVEICPVYENVIE